MPAALAVVLALTLAQPAPEAPGAYVAVGYGGRRLVSRDGAHWEISAQWAEKGGDDSKNLMGLVFAKGKFVATGGGGGGSPDGGHILVSTDGRAWREVKTMRFRVHPALFGNGRFVVGAPDRRFWSSEDAETWNEGAQIADERATHFRLGAFGNGVFVAVGNGRDGKTGKEIHWAAVTADGTKITGYRDNLPPVRGLAFGAGRFVLVGPNGLRLSSTDGVRWNERADAAGEDFSSIVWTGKQFLITGGKTTMSSPDGLAWKAWPKRIPCEVLYADERVYIGTSWPGQMWTSRDGLEWQRCETMTENGINRVTGGPIGERDR